MQIDENFILKEMKNKLDIQYYHKIFNEQREIKTEWMLEPQKPENLVEDVFRKILNELNIPDNRTISQNRVRIFDVFKNKNRYPDFKLTKHRLRDKDLLIELEPFNSDIQVGINQAKEWIQDVRIGTVSHALVINLNHFILIFFDGTDVKDKELTVEQACKLISETVLGEKTTIRIEDINKITEQFYNQFSALIHGGNYISIRRNELLLMKIMRLLII